MCLKQEEYIAKAAEKFQIGNMRNVTPMEFGLQIAKPENFDKNLPLKELLGTLMYTTVCCQPDVGYAVNFLCRYSSTPTQEILKYARRVLA